MRDGALPSATDLVADLLHRTGGSLEVTIYLLRQSLVLAESARDIRDLNRQRDEDQR